MTNRAECYREHGRECLRLVNVLPPGLQRDRVIGMAHEWVWLADLLDGIAADYEEADWAPPPPGG